MYSQFDSLYYDVIIVVMKTSSSLWLKLSWWGCSFYLKYDKNDINHLYKNGACVVVFSEIIVFLTYNDVIMSPMLSKIGASRLFAQQFVGAQIKENIRAPRHWSWWRKCIGDRWNPLTKASNAEDVSIRWHHHVELRNTLWEYHGNPCC